MSGSAASGGSNVSPAQVYVAAGSNIEPQAKLRQALQLLEQRFGRLEVSPAYRNKAVGFAGDDFINLVVGLETTLSVAELLPILHKIEQLAGRPREAPKFGPRTLDLDLLLYDDLVCAMPAATLPRPDLVKRAYMLRPMAELAPELLHPVLGKSFAALWREFDQAAHPLRPVEL